MGQNPYKAIKWYQKAVNQGYIETQSILKRFFKKIHSNVHLPPSLSQTAEDKIIKLKEQLQRLESIYLPQATTPVHSLGEDSLGENPYLSALCNDINTSLKDYDDFLDNIHKPGFLVSCIAPTIKLFFSLQGRIGDSPKAFVCW